LKIEKLAEVEAVAGVEKAVAACNWVEDLDFYDQLRLQRKVFHPKQDCPNDRSNPFEREKEGE